MNAESDPQLNREVFLSLWKIHVLHHSSKGEIVGRWMLKELQEHGYDASPGMLYPMLRRLEKHGWLISRTEPGAGPKAPRYYRITDYGRDILTRIRAQLAELKQEIN